MPGRLNEACLIQTSEENEFSKGSENGTSSFKPWIQTNVPATSLRGKNFQHILRVEITGVANARMVSSGKLLSKWHKLGYFTQRRSDQEGA